MKNQDAATETVYLIRKDEITPKENAYLHRCLRSGKFRNLAEGINAMEDIVMTGAGNSLVVIVAKVDRRLHEPVRVFSRLGLLRLTEDGIEEYLEARKRQDAMQREAAMDEAYAKLETIYPG